MPKLLALAACLAVSLAFVGSRRAAAQDPPGAGVGAAPSTAQVTKVEPVTVLFLRHAEKGSDDPRDPGLSEEGERRAQALAKMLAASGVTHLFSTEYRRTRDTLAPLAKSAGVEVEVVSARTARAQLEKLRALPPGSVAVVAGHSNTTPSFVAELGGEIEGLTETPRGPMLGEDEYDRLFLVTLPAAEGVATSVVELRY